MTSICVALAVTSPWSHHKLVYGDSANTRFVDVAWHLYGPGLDLVRSHREEIQQSQSLVARHYNLLKIAAKYKTRPKIHMYCALTYLRPLRSHIMRRLFILASVQPGLQRSARVRKLVDERAGWVGPWWTVTPQPATHSPHSTMYTLQGASTQTMAHQHHHTILHTWSFLVNAR